MRWLHVLAELALALLLGAVMLVAGWLAMVAGWKPFLGLGAGFGALIAASVAVRHRWLLAAQSRRFLFDLWLAAALPAGLLTFAAFLVRWPVRMRGGDAHGWGTTGGEGNAALFFWLHAGFLLLLAAWWLRTARRQADLRRVDGS